MLGLRRVSQAGPIRIGAEVVTMTREETVDLVNAWARAVTACDLDALNRLVVPPLRDGVAARTRAVHTAFAEIEVVPVQIVAEGDAVAWRWRLTGTHVGAIGGVAPSGARKSIEGVNFQRLSGGVVVDHWTTVDLAALSRP
jgi:predicted ester cyclase